MRLSQAYLPTRKEDPADAEVVSHKLLVRGGYIRMLTRGIYNFLPMGWRSVRKIEEVVRQEMDRAGAQEVRLPAVQPAELWQESGRWEEYGPELLRFEDRKGGDFCFGPTHEEVITDMIRGDIKSYKQLPMNLYQIQTKFRDEIRPRFGLMRGREFIMKDAYSFDVDLEAAKESYDKMYEAYDRICDRLGFDYAAVEADTGNIGGSHSHEFQVLAETGEDAIVTCPDCGYAANVEKAEIAVADGERDEDQAAMETVDTPGASSIDEICEFLDVQADQVVKTLIYRVDDELVAVLLRGDHNANEVKIGAAVSEALDWDAIEVELATDAQIKEATGSPVGFAGPVGLEMPVIADRSVETMSNVVVGANAADKHHVNANHGRDFEVQAFADVREARAGDPCGRCGGTFEAHRGIEIGHVFLLGDKYAQAMEANYLDNNGRHQPIQMGCYGIGITRILAAVVEQNHDDDGIIWPMPIAPYQVLMSVLHPDNEDVKEAADEIYDALSAEGIEVLMDDRDMGIGAKFKDADLVGIPLRLVLGGRGVGNGEVEWKWRDSDEQENVPLDEVVERAVEGVRARLNQG